MKTVAEADNTGGVQVCVYTAVCVCVLVGCSTVQDSSGADNSTQYSGALAVCSTASSAQHHSKSTISTMFCAAAAAAQYIAQYAGRCSYYSSSDAVTQHITLLLLVLLLLLVYDVTGPSLGSTADMYLPETSRFLTRETRKPTPVNSKSTPDTVVPSHANCTALTPALVAPCPGTRSKVAERLPLPPDLESDNSPSFHNARRFSGDQVPAG